MQIWVPVWRVFSSFSLLLLSATPLLSFITNYALWNGRVENDANIFHVEVNLTFASIWFPFYRMYACKSQTTHHRIGSHARCTVDKWKTESLMTDWQNDKLIYSKQFVCLQMRCASINGLTNGKRQWNCFNAVGSFIRRMPTWILYIYTPKPVMHEHPTYTYIYQKHIKNIYRALRYVQSKKASINKTLLFTVAHKFTCICASGGCMSTFDIHS